MSFLLQPSSLTENQVLGCFGVLDAWNIVGDLLEAVAENELPPEQLAGEGRRQLIEDDSGRCFRHEFVTRHPIGW